MPNKSTKILLLEDNPADVLFMREALSDSPWLDLTDFERLSQGLDELERTQYDLILADLGLPDSSGIKTLEKLVEQAPHLPVIVLTGLSDEKVGIEAVRLGAQDYWIKGQLQKINLARTIRYAIERKQVEEKLRESEEKNRTLYLSATKRLSQTVALRNIDRAISNSLDLKFTLDVVLTQTLGELEVDAADILVYNPITHILNFFLGQGFRTVASQDAHIPLGQGYAGRAVLERAPIHLTNLSTSKTEFNTSPLFPLEEFEQYHCVPLIAKGKILGVLETFERNSVEHPPEWLDYLETLAGQAAIAIDNIALFDDLQRANDKLVLGYDATIEGWSRALDLRDKETEGHTQRVTTLSMQLARLMGIDDEKLVHVRRGALLHDIGKMGVPDGILMKPGKLTDEEWAVMKQHPRLAYEMLAPIDYLRDALDIPHYHHEKWDGSGYPAGMTGEQIPFAARIFAVVDVYDALTSDRHYRKAWTKEKALEHIRTESGKHFDPKVVEAFLGVDLE
jgi:putative nucleotidyltransferase with HDIG domain